VSPSLINENKSKEKLFPNVMEFPGSKLCTKNNSATESTKDTLKQVNPHLTPEKGEKLKAPQIFREK
jgi:hypothetical protein